ncbi:MAG: hemolysin III family protein [Acidobacteriota bacterium]
MRRSKNEETDVSEAAPIVKRSQSFGEEIANSVSHGIALFAIVLAAVPILVINVVRNGNAANVAGVGIFALTLVMVYLASTVYHALPHGRAKRIFHAFDHSAIFLLIAGTYTPFMLGVLRGGWGWTLLAIVWGLAIAGIGLKVIGGVNNTRVFVVLYVAMGWLALIAIKPILARVPIAGLMWILAGGFAYTLGLVFFGLDRLRYHHFVWHLFVLIGSLCHIFAVLWYAS